MQFQDVVNGAKHYGQVIYDGAYNYGSIFCGKALELAQFIKELVLPYFDSFKNWAMDNQGHGAVALVSGAAGVVVASIAFAFRKVLCCDNSTTTTGTTPTATGTTPTHTATGITPTATGTTATATSTTPAATNAAPVVNASAPAPAPVTT